MIKRRNPDKNNVVIEEEVLETKPPILDFQNVKSYLDEAIEVLNYLEKNGDDIYDPDRTPGMYLKNHSKSSENLSEFFSKKQTKINKKIKENDEVSTFSNTTLNNFFK